MILTENQYNDDVQDDFLVDINTPAIAAAYVIKSYSAQESDELSFEIGDIISIIEIPSSDENIWWRGKKDFQVGFFPSDCVEIIGDPSSLVLLDKSFYPSQNSLNSSKELSNKLPQQSQTDHTVLRDSGRILTFFRSIIPNRQLSRTASAKYSQRLAALRVNKVFGCDLSKHLYSSCRVIPLVLKCCAEFIEKHGLVDGIYRLSGVKSNIHKLREDFDLERIPDLTEDAILQDIHCVASLLKMYFRELPNPLLTYELYEKFIQAIQPDLHCSPSSSDDIPEATKLANLRDVVKQLPPAHYRTLEYLLRHLSRVASHGARTGMTSKNVAIVWAPNLLRSKDLETSGPFGALHFVGVQAVLTEYLIKYVNILFNKDLKSRSRSGSLRPKSLPVSCSKLLTLEEARGRSGCLIDQPCASDFYNVNNQDNTRNLSSKYHTVIDSVRRRADHGNPGNNHIPCEMKKVNFHLNYLHSHS